MPQRYPRWSDLKAAYRLLSHPRVRPQRIARPHAVLTRRACAGHRLVLCVQDDTDLSAVKVRAGVHKQHSTLAVLPDGRLLGVLDACWFTRPRPAEDETRLEREVRWRESCVWTDAVAAVGAAPAGCRFIHVADRAADDLNVIEACVRQGVGFVIRARHDRRVNDPPHKLWSWRGDQPVAATLTIEMTAQAGHHGRPARPSRMAQVSVRYSRVQLQPPWNHPGEHAPRTVTAVHLREDQPPAGQTPVDWMLLSDQAVACFDDARRLIGYYQRRWVIEEWHRVLKEGCRLEASQLDQADDLMRLAAILSVIAVRLLQLRDLADPQPSDGRGDDPAALQQAVPTLWRLVVAELAQCDPARLTPRRFWRTIAHQGGYLGRQRDPRPGWKVIWLGWYDIMQMIRGAELMQKTLTRQTSG
jgi:hypothetical protein